MLILVLIALLVLAFFLSRPVRRTVWSKPGRGEVGFSSPPESPGRMAAVQIRAQDNGSWTALPDD